jgi:3-isopropylmalate/(R)-2-methylmalate dehydratase large subunit
MGIGINGSVPTLDQVDETERASFLKSLQYMGLDPGEKLLGKKIDYVSSVPAPTAA